MVIVAPWIFRILYRLINRFDREKLVIFMNYGYSAHGEDLILSDDDEKNRYPIQLYRHLTDKINLDGKRMVEIGCGRGGGLSHIARNSESSSLIGMDIEKTAVEFAAREYKEPNLSFLKGNAEEVPLPDNSCDVVLNVESSHRYLAIDRFIREVSRILKPDGTFLFTDFRYPHEWAGLKDLIEKAGMAIQSEIDITENVILSLRKDNDRRLALVHNYVPRILRKGIINFSGCVGSETFRNFDERVYEYRSFLIINKKQLL